MSTVARCTLPYLNVRNGMQQQQYNADIRNARQQTTYFCVSRANTAVVILTHCIPCQTRLSMLLFVIVHLFISLQE